MLFTEFLLVADSILSLIGSSIIFFVGLKAAYFYLKGVIANYKVDMNDLRLELGQGIILGLEFMIGADIIESMAKPTVHDVAILAVLVLIRTFLSYFLGKELAQLKTDAQVK